MSSIKKKLNANLHQARKIKDDEFYTMYKDIDKEVSMYKSQLKPELFTAML